jgi:hypothetical protein
MNEMDVGATAQRRKKREREREREVVLTIKK